MSNVNKVFRWVVNTANWPFFGGPGKNIGTCPRCKAEVSATAKICAKCGEPLPGREPTFRNSAITRIMRLVALAIFLLIIAWIIAGR